MTKSEIAKYLASTDISVRLGMQTESYWFNQYMKMKKAELETLLERRTDPTEVARVEAALPGMLAAR